MADDLGTAKISLIVDMGDWDVAIARSKNSLANLSNDSVQTFNNTTHASKRAAASLADYVAYLGKTREQTALLRAAKNGVDPAAIASAAEQMRAYAEAAAYAENEQRQLAASLAQMKIGEGILNDLRQQIATFGMGKNELLLYRASLAGVQAEAVPLVATLDRLNREQEIAGFRAQATAAAFQQQIAAASGYANSQQAAEQATRRRADAEAAFLPLLEREAELNKAATTRGEFLRQLDRESKTIGKTRSEIMELRAAELGLTQQAAPLIAKLREQEQALLGSRRAADLGKKAINEYGLSQKQFEFAMRGVPAQITDIAISLQGGQNPLTVFLQQGGQLKDMFGGIKPAAAALGGELLKLVNVYTVSAAGVATLLAAWVQAEKQQHDLNVALATTNNYVGTSAAKIGDLVDKLDSLKGVSQGGARTALTEVAKSGRIASDSFELVSIAAARMAYSTGQAVDTTVDKFEEISKSPLEALQKLTATEHFLTVEQNARIKTLIDQGNRTEAVAEATRIYADHLNTVASISAQSLPMSARMWADIKDNIGGAFSELVEYVGLMEQFANKQLGLEKSGGVTVGKILTSQFQMAKGFVGLANDFARDFWDLGGSAQQAQGPASLFDVESAKAAEEATKKRVEGEKEWQKQIAQTDRALAWRLKQGELAEKAFKGGVNLDSDEYRMVLAAEEKRFNEAWDRRGKTAQESFAALNGFELQAIRDRLALEKSAIQSQQQLNQSAYANRQITAEEYYSRQRELILQSTSVEEDSLRKQIAFLSTANGNKREAINNQRQIGELETRLAQLREKSATDLALFSAEEARYYRERQYAIEDYARSLEEATEAIQRDYAMRANSIGIGAREAEIQNALTDVYVRQEAALRDLNLQLSRKQISEVEFSQKSNDLVNSTNAQVEAIHNGYAQISSAEADWRNGFTSVAADYQQKMLDIAGNTRTLLEGTFDGFNDAIQEAVMTGKANLDDLGRYLAKMAVQFGTTKIFSYLMSMWGGGVGPVQREAITPVFNAKGNVYDSPSLSAYSNGVFNSPQVFAFAKGAGVFGEAGPEAIMPLARTSSGDLGVQVAGAGRGAAPQINVNVYGIEGGADVNVKESAPGVFDIDVIAAQLERKQAAGIMNGTSVAARAMQKRYNLKEA